MSRESKDTQQTQNSTQYSKTIRQCTLRIATSDKRDPLIIVNSVMSHCLRKMLLFFWSTRWFSFFGMERLCGVDVCRWGVEVGVSTAAEAIPMEEWT